MTKVLLLVIGLALAGVAQAQIKCWTGADGKRGCGDVPPPGARLDAPKGAPATKDTKQAAPVPAPQALENRGRQVESEKVTTRYQVEKAPATGNPQECERARETLKAMGGGGRSKRTDAVKARAQYQNNCPA